jgi:ABC-type cobalamin transport system permease subunit
LDIVLIFRGDAQDFGVKLTAGRIQTDGYASVVLRKMSDILIGYSTLPGFASKRDVYLGTWYINAICEVFMEHACDTDVEDMLKMVSLSFLIFILITWFLDFITSVLLKEIINFSGSGSAAIHSWGA